MTDQEILTGKHIDMVSDVLPELKKLDYIKFFHKKFSNTRKMEQILVKVLDMKPEVDNDEYCTQYEKK